MPTAREILRRAEEVRSPATDYTVDFTLDATDPGTSWKERSATYTLVAQGKDYSFVMMRQPKLFYPGTLLIAKGLYWMLLPRSKKPFQLAPRHVLSGDISNGDLARGNLLEYYDVELDGEETVRDEPCWRLKLTRSSFLGMYKSIRARITKKDFRPWKFEYYGETGALLKAADYEDYRETALGIRAMRIQVYNRVRPGEKTVLTFSNLRPIDASVLDFSIAGMQAFRDMALERTISEKQVEVEELLTAFGTHPAP